MLTKNQGIWGVPAYMMQGVHAQVNKICTRSVTNYIITSRIVQGTQDMAGAGEEEKADIVVRWNNMKSDLKNFEMLKRKERTAEKVPSAAGKPESPFSHAQSKLVSYPEPVIRREEKCIDPEERIC